LRLRLTITAYVTAAGLPDGFFSNQKYRFGYILEGLAMEDVGIFYGHLVYFTAIGVFCGHLIYFIVIWYIFRGSSVLYQEKSGNPGRQKCERLAKKTSVRLLSNMYTQKRSKLCSK
jgi:hypothetical protein